MDLSDVQVEKVPTTPDLDLSNAYRYVLQYLEDSQWSFKEQPRVGALQPDLLATSPDGKDYLVEFKIEEKGSAHFGALAQLVRFQDEYARINSDKLAGAVLVTNLQVGEPFARAAQQLGVRIVPMGRSIDELRENLRAELTG